MSARAVAMTCGRLPDHRGFRMRLRSPGPGRPTSPGAGELPFRPPGKHGFVVWIMLAGRAPG
jgi:hypothetical protein